MVEVYTAITNDKDYPRTDIKVFDEYNKFKDPCLNAKIYKLLPHKFLDADITIWVDGNIFLEVPAEQLVEEWLGDADMAMLRHYKRQDIYWEHKWIPYAIKNHPNKNFQLKEVNEQIEHYRKIGVPDNIGLWMGGVIIRRNIPSVNRLNEAWWAEVCRWSIRDQVSFPVVLRKFPEIKINRVDADIKSHPYLKYVDHRQYTS